MFLVFSSDFVFETSWVDRFIEGMGAWPQAVPYSRADINPIGFREDGSLVVSVNFWVYYYATMDVMCIYSGALGPGRPRVWPEGQGSQVIPYRLGPHNHNATGETFSVKNHTIWRNRYSNKILRCRNDMTGYYEFEIPTDLTVWTTGTNPDRIVYRIAETTFQPLPNPFPLVSLRGAVLD